MGKLTLIVRKCHIATSKNFFYLDLIFLFSLKVHIILDKSEKFEFFCHSWKVDSYNASEMVFFLHGTHKIKYHPNGLDEQPVYEVTLKCLDFAAFVFETQRNAAHASSINSIFKKQKAFLGGFHATIQENQYLQQFRRGIKYKTSASRHIAHWWLALTCSTCFCMRNLFYVVLSSGSHFQRIFVIAYLIDTSLNKNKPLWLRLLHARDDSFIEANKFFDNLALEKNVECPPPRTTARLLDKV